VSGKSVRVREWKWERDNRSALKCQFSSCYFLLFSFSILILKKIGERER
jgi:hypothetical protein